MVEKTCVICGEHFSSKRWNRLTCSEECAALRKRQLTRKSTEKNYYRRLEESRRRHKEKHSINKKSAAAIEFHNLRLQRQREARELGLSYAQYIAQKGIKEI